MSMHLGSFQPIHPLNGGHVGTQQAGRSSGAIIQRLPSSSSLPLNALVQYRAAVMAPHQLPSHAPQGSRWPHRIVRRAGEGLLHQPALAPFDGACTWMSTQWPKPPQEKAQDEEMIRRVAYFSDRSRLFQSDRSRHFSVIVVDHGAR
jgi:hypothetical protein